MIFKYIFAMFFILSSTPSFSENLVPSGKCELIVASRDNLSAAQDYISEEINNKQFVKIFKSQNGLYAISVGSLNRGAEEKRVISKWKNSGKIPQDSFCSSGRLFVSEIDYKSNSRHSPRHQSIDKLATLDNIFSLDMIMGGDGLGADLSYFEHHSGPAISTSRSENITHRKYKINGCYIETTTENGKISSISLEWIREKCTFNIGSIRGQRKKLLVHEMTLDKFYELTGAQTLKLNSYCLTSCGNYSEPTIEFMHDPGRAGGFINIELSYITNTPLYKLTDKMEKEKGQEWVIDRIFNCGGITKYDKEAYKILRKRIPDSIRIGRFLNQEECPLGEKAYKLYNECLLEDAQSCTVLGIMYGVGVENEVSKDEYKSKNFIKKGCDKNDSTACFIAGAAHYYSNGVYEDNPQKAVKYLKKACDLGDKDSCDLLISIKNK